MGVSKTIATAFGAGLSPIAPGTAGAIVGVVLAYGSNSAMQAAGLNNILIACLNVALVLIISCGGVFSIRKVHGQWKHDDNRIVVDEVAGVWLATLFVPLNWHYYLAAFVLFRFFDIRKPLFIKQLDRLETDWAVMLDDLLAGLYASILLQLYLALFT